MSLDTILIASVLTPASLLDDLKAVFKTVHYVPLPPVGPNDAGAFPAGTVFPTAEQVASADVILSLFVPPSLVSYEQAPRLKLFQTISAGYAQITSSAFFKSLPEDSEVTFASASGIHVSAIGEHVIATTLCLYHRLNEIQLRMNEGKWFSAQVLFKGLFVKTLRGQTVGIVGYGHIGRETARMAASFGANVIALTRAGVSTPESGYIVPNTGDPTGLLPSKYYASSSPEAKAAFFSACDVVVDTLPSSAATTKLIGESELKAMKGSAVFVNIGRGDTVDQVALVKALTAETAEGEEPAATGTLRIGGASLDVTDPEPLPASHPLFTLPNVILTPHMSGLSQDYFVLTVDLLLQNTERLRAGKGVFNAFRGKGE